MKKAIAALGAEEMVIRGTSRFFSSPAFPVGAGPDFVNAALRIQTQLSAYELLSALHRIEADFGRLRRTRWSPRTLDLDLIGYDDLILPNRATYLEWAHLPLDLQMLRAPGELVLPHPRLADRGFVLVPLMDVAPDWRHPVTGATVRDMVSALSKKQISEVVAL